MAHQTKAGKQLQRTIEKIKNVHFGLKKNSTCINKINKIIEKFNDTNTEYEISFLSSSDLDLVAGWQEVEVTQKDGQRNSVHRVSMP